MLKYGLFVAVFAVVAVVARPQSKAAAPPKDEVSVIRYEESNNAEGTFSWTSELSDGSKIEQSGYVKPGEDPENAIQVIQGAYSYYSPEGDLIAITYIADENGFQPQGDHLPTPPPIPEAIQKALDIIYANADSQKANAESQKPSGPAQKPKPRRP